MYYGFDVGGTKIEFGAFNEKLERVATERVPTPTDDYQLLLDTIAGLVKNTTANSLAKAKSALVFLAWKTQTTAQCWLLTYRLQRGNHCVKI